MIEHVTQWLGAYHDDELRGARLAQVEEHLAQCAACRAELEELRSLSALLQTVPAGDFLPADRFASNLALSLPRQSLPPASRKFFSAGWWLVPVGLLGIWLFLAITLSFSSVITLAGNAGLFTGSLAWLQGQPAQMEWFTTVMNLFGGQVGGLGSAALAVVNDADVFLAQLAGNYLPQLVLAAGYLAWLGLWWMRRPDQPPKRTGNLS